VKAIDTNLLVYAEIDGSAHCDRARELIETLAEGSEPWAIPWPCVYELLRVVTHPRVFHPPVPLPVALDDLAAIMASPSLLLLAETERHAEVLVEMYKYTKIAGEPQW